MSIAGKCAGNREFEVGKSAIELSLVRRGCWSGRSRPMQGLAKDWPKAESG